MISLINFNKNLNIPHPLQDNDYLEILIPSRKSKYNRWTMRHIWTQEYEACRVKRLK